MGRYVSLFFLLSFLLLLGCASILSQRIPQTLERPRPCQEFFEQLDEKVREGCVRDASTFSVPGFPYLRTSRFLSALKERLKDDKARMIWSDGCRNLTFDPGRKRSAIFQTRWYAPSHPKTDPTGRVCMAGWSPVLLNF